MSPSTLDRCEACGRHLKAADKVLRYADDATVHAKCPAKPKRKATKPHG